MTLEFLENGQEGTTEHFSNGLELGIKLIQPIKDKKVFFSVKRSSAFFNQGIDLPIEKENKGVIELNTFLNTVIKSAEDYLNFRDLDGRSHNLSAAKSELEEIKEIIKSLV
ncbi:MULTISPECIES: hypothetical protein [Bacillaceae]|uniref:Uncharacterized protein n=1 Tax=Alkalicoccobacillus plakortidis TaxID=444060 RepID=A0A9D5DN50_9BACI|nr:MULTISPECIES: hypothetical protein [Bacillaceae]KQL57117.1 hypothetical protein AN965_10625 [Alkalicoccobacillus plakortidis]